MPPRAERRHAVVKPISRKVSPELLDFIESLPWGVALFDAKERLIACNLRYKKCLHPETAALVRPGVELRELLTRFTQPAPERGTRPDRAGLPGQPGRCIDGGEEHELRLPDGHWLLNRTYRTGAGRTLSLHIDVTDRKRAEADLERAHRQLSFHVENSPLAVIECDRTCRVQRWSAQAERIFGWRAEEVLGKNPFDWRFVHEFDIQKVKRVWRDLMTGSALRQIVRTRNYTKAGDVLLCEWYNSALADETGQVVSVVSLVQDVTEAHELSEQLSFHAAHDPLTGLPNRGEFERCLQAAVDSARAEAAEHTMCYLDLDRFKVINDTCGYVAGDELLCQLGRMLPARVRRGDLLARLGGDEFGILMENCATEHAKRAAHEIREAIEEFRFAWEGKRFGLGVSIGLAPVTAASQTVTSVMAAADAACHAAKEHGRNRIHVYREGDAELEQRQSEMQWVQRIQAALDEGRFRLYFQPIVPVEDDDAKGEHYELLLRMVEGGEVVPPGLFLPAAERYHLVDKLDRWVISEALGWLSAHPGHLEQLYLCSINVSGQSLSDEEFLTFVTRCLDDTDLPPEKLCFEITETAAIANLTSANRFMSVLRGWGCKFALDDFGIGFSSFAYLKSLPVDFLKIDGVFIRNILNDPFDLAMVKSINEIGQALGKKTIAEFVESQAIMEKLRLRHIGIDYAQGYYVGAPQPLEEARFPRRPVRT
jgi:diguanylate cyclase (GGDEF)-like protein/PAS domain S-box-containing protein